MSFIILKISILNSCLKWFFLEDFYGMGFDISLFYDGIYFSEFLILVIYNDVCYNCSVILLECSIMVII